MESNRVRITVVRGDREEETVRQRFRRSTNRACLFSRARILFSFSFCVRVFVNKKRIHRSFRYDCSTTHGAYKTRNINFPTEKKKQTKNQQHNRGRGGYLRGGDNVRTERFIFDIFIMLTVFRQKRLMLFYWRAFMITGLRLNSLPLNYILNTY